MIIVSSIAIVTAIVLAGLQFIDAHNQYVVAQRTAFTDHHRSGAPEDDRDTGTVHRSMMWSELDEHQLHRFLDGSPP